MAKNIYLFRRYKWWEFALLYLLVKVGRAV